MSTELDASIELVQLVAADELEELIHAAHAALASDIGIFDRSGNLVAGVAAASVRRPIEHAGECIGELAAEGPAAAAALDMVGTSLSLLIRHARQHSLAVQAHETAMGRTFADLTDHNHRLQRAVARLEELDRLKSNFLATMSHELRTPLTSVIGYAEMMAEGLTGALTSEQQDYLVTILYKAEQLLSTITTVLDVAQLESGPVVLERTALSLAEIVASEVATYVPYAAKRDIRIQIDSGAEGQIVGDKKKLRQVVANLVSNAVKFTPDSGSVSVVLQSGALSPHDTERSTAVQLVVTDSGIGISRDQMSKVFEPFFQVDSSSTRAFGGTGLGLTLAKAYVEAHGGRIWVDSTPGVGSTFTAAFPLTSDATPGIVDE